MKFCKFSVYELSALAIIACATLLRLLLISLNYPILNSDEGTIGIMARHIAYRGEWPIFFYGQHYMGGLEAYIGAVLFHLFGASLFSLRLGLILMFGLFLVSTYLLTSLLYSKAWALISLALSGVGSSFVLSRQLSAIGGYPETLLFGSMAFLFASTLALSYQPGSPLGRQGWRYTIYIGWGFVVGLGMWSDLLIVPFVLMSGLLLLLFCWRELVRMLAALCILLGFVIGAAPLICYNLFYAAPGQDSLSILQKLQHGGHTSLDYGTLLTKELTGTFQVSIPMMTGNPFCPVTEVPFLGPTSPNTFQCVLIRDIWSAGYLLLFALAILLALVVVWRSWWRWQVQKSGGLADHRSPRWSLGLGHPQNKLAMQKDLTLEERRNLVRHSTRLMLLGGAMLALLFYTFSDAPVDWPGIHARYLIGLLIATPAIFWPLWSAICATGSRMTNFARIRKLASAAVLILIGGILLLGTVFTFGELPAAQAANGRQQDLIAHLLSIGATHIYTDYWTCNRIAFASQERIICGVLSGTLRPSHNRDPHYYTIVSHDPHTAYVFDPGSYSQAAQRKLVQAGVRYRRFAFDGYIIYQPV